MILCAANFWPFLQTRVTSVKSSPSLNFPNWELTSFWKSFHCKQSLSELNIFNHLEPWKLCFLKQVTHICIEIWVETIGLRSLDVGASLDRTIAQYRKLNGQNAQGVRSTQINFALMSDWRGSWMQKPSIFTFSFYFVLFSFPLIFLFYFFFHPSFFLGRAKSINGSWWRYRYVSTPFSAQKVPWMIHAIPFFSSKYAG